MPFELPAWTSVPLVVRNENGESEPVEVLIVPQDPGIFSVFKLGLRVDSQNLIRPGDQITIYATGLGQVSPPVASGQAGPSYPLAAMTTAPLVKVGGQLARVEYAGLAPGYVGVYQINATVPSGPSTFSAITSSTNTSAAMVVGSGASLSVSGTGTIAATSLVGPFGIPVAGILCGGGEHDFHHRYGPDEPRSDNHRDGLRLRQDAGDHHGAAFQHQ